MASAEPWHDGSYLNEVTMDFKTPCHPMAELAELQPKILFILPRIGARDAVELMQLMPSEFGAVLCGSRTELVYKNQYESYMTGTDAESKQKELHDKLAAKPWNVVVIGSHDLGVLPDASRRKVLAMVFRGTGLLIVNLSADNPREEMIPPGEPKPAPVESWIDADATTWMHGSGRVVLLKWKKSLPANEPFSLVSPPEYDSTWRSQYHTQLAGIGQFIRYAAGFSLELEKPKRRIRDRWNNVWNGEDMPAGIYYHDFMSGTGAFAVKSETIPSPVGTITIDIPRTVEPYAEFAGKFTIEQPFGDASTATIELLDSPYGRIWFKKSIALEAGQKEVAFTVEKHCLPTMAGYLRVTVHHPINKKSVAIEEKELYFPNRNFADYEQLMWCVARSESIAMQVVDKLGFRMGLSAGDGSYVTRTAKLNQRLVTYTSGIRYSLNADENGRVVLPKNALSSSLVPDGDYCFYRPNVQQYWREMAGKMIRELKPALYDLGDELRFSYQAGYSSFDNFYFRQFLQHEYGTIQELNANWRTKYASFEDVPVTEGRNTKNFAAWGDHRAYMEKMYADGLAFLRKEIQKLDPDSYVGMEGSACGDIELTMGQLDYYSPYSHCVNDEVMRSFCKATIRSTWHGGYPNNTHGGRIRYPLILLEGLVKG
ncbi:MAG: beta-galactosidase, partial [Victivallales bacterium]|nr:beta-galactosidase [Victivallales bacterium]